MSKIKIWFTHRVGSNNIILKNNIFDAIRTGAYKEEYHTIQPDCEGDNISQKNASYCELTAQYWAWKNFDADYYGFCHYRRMLTFSDEKFKLDKWSAISENYLTDAILDKYKIIDEAQVENVVSNFDVIAPLAADLTKNGVKNIYEQYKLSPQLNIEDIDLTLQIIKEICPRYYDSAIQYFRGIKGYFYNIFVMKKELFNEYCSFLFTVLEEFDKRKDISHYCAEGYRTPGHIGERLFGVFLTYLKKQNKYKIGYKPVVFFSHTEKQKELRPAFETNNIPIIFASSEFYLQFASATILSLIDNSSINNNYDIIILGKDFSSDAKRRLQSIVDGKQNFSLRFYDVGFLFSAYKLYETSTISVETYYRLIIPETFCAYDKVLYLDSDLIVFDDIAKLYNVNIGDNYLGAVQDIVYKALINDSEKVIKDYYDNFNCECVDHFVNAGVLIMNTRKLRQDFSMRFLLDLAQQGEFRFQDQDLLNIVCEKNIHFIDFSWNYFADALHETDFIGLLAPHESFEEYKKFKKEIHILHYAGARKPWWFPEMLAGDYFWRHFRKSPFYEVFLTQRMTDYIWSIVHSELENCDLKKSKRKKEKLKKSKFLRLLPKGTRRREVVKKIVLFFTGKPYIEPNYEAEGIVVKYKQK